jgi:hypothetical protein
MTCRWSFSPNTAWTDRINNLIDAACQQRGCALLDDETGAATARSALREAVERLERGLVRMDLARDEDLVAKFGGARGW